VQTSLTYIPQPCKSFQTSLPQTLITTTTTGITVARVTASVRAEARDAGAQDVTLCWRVSRETEEVNGGSLTNIVRDPVGKRQWHVH